MPARLRALRMSFRLRVGLVAFALLLVGLGALVAYVARSQHTLVEESAKAAYLQFARGLSVMVREHVARGKKDRIGDHIALVLGSGAGEIRYIAVDDAEGRTFAVAGKAAPSPGPILEERVVEVGPPPRSLLHREGHVFELGVPVVDGGRRIGALRMGISTEREAREVFSLLQAVLIPTVLGLVVFAGLALFVDARLRGMLRRLIEATHRMAEGELERPVDIRTGDDLEALAQNFNRMAVALQEREAELRGAKETLEAAVRDRTRELSEEKERLDGIVGAVGAGMLLLDPGMKVLWANHVAVEWFGPRERLVGSPCSWAGCGPAGSCPSCPSRAAAASGRTEVADAIPVEVEGRRRWFTVISSPVRGPDGKVTEVLELLLDITRRKEVEEELLQAGKLASLGELAGGVAHEIGNPVAIISGKARLLREALREGRTPERLPADLEKIERHAERIGRIATGLLSFARRSTRERTPLDAGEAVREAVSLLEHRLDPGGIRLALRVEPGLPKVVACRAEIVQVLVNLLQNALDAMPGGGDLRVEVTGADGWVRVLVADTGSGMDEPTRRRIFDPFFTTKEPGRGTGLGLSLSHRIVRDHGGEISVDSGAGSGSRFTVRLPAEGEVPHA